MSELKTPVFIDAEEADELCIQVGWYISDGRSLSVGHYTGIPFGSEQEAADYISDSHPSDSTSVD